MWYFRFFGSTISIAILINQKGGLKEIGTKTKITKNLNIDFQK